MAKGEKCIRWERDSRGQRRCAKYKQRRGRRGLGTTAGMTCSRTKSVYSKAYGHKVERCAAYK